MRQGLISMGLLFWAVTSAAAQGLPPIPLETYRLGNGLEVILSPDHSSQVVTIDVWYNVGSRNEVRGRTGFAHLFEHMMFQGSANVKKADHFVLIARAGGQTDGTTSEDRTAYFEELPSNRINLGLWLEADRMRSLAITDTNLHNQREAVKEERRLRVDNQPYASLFFEGVFGLQDSASCFPYAHSVIGSMDDLNAAKTEDVKAFFDLYYTPNNATLVVTGDFDPPATKQLIEQYFGPIQRGKDPPPVQCESRLNSGRIRRPWPDSKATLPAVFATFRGPAYDDPDYPALVLLSTVLGQGESSRLNRTVVREQRRAQGACAGMNLDLPRRGPGAFYLGAIANQGVVADSLERSLLAQVDIIRRDGITPAELERAKNGYLANRLEQQQISLNLAEAIQHANLFLGDPEKLNTDPARYQAVTVEDVKRVAEKYLGADNSLVLIVSPGTTR